VRLFVALDLPDPVRQSLAAWRAPLPGARWTPAARLHLTLRFVGEADERTRAALTDRLRAVVAPPVPVRADGAVRLPSARRPRVVAAHVAPTPELEAAWAAVQAAVAAAGAEPEGRPLLPHVTLARLGRSDAAAVRRALRSAERPSAEGVVRSLSLVRSERRPAGRRYAALVTVPLAG
jgi:2'-5' RNA ligase